MASNGANLGFEQKLWQMGGKMIDYPINYPINKLKEKLKLGEEIKNNMEVHLQ